MFLADLHVHSNYSDGQLTIPQLVDLYGLQGFGAIAITDHVCESNTWLGKAAHYLSYSLDEKKFLSYMYEIKQESIRAWEQYRLLLLPGLELSKNSFSNHRSAHIIGINIQNYISADLNTIDILKAIKDQNGISIAAHPVWTRRLEPQTFHLWDQRETLIHYFDAWEVASGPHLFHEVAHSCLPKVASSDLHRPEQLQSWKTIFYCEKHPEAMAEALRRQQVEFYFYQNTESSVHNFYKKHGQQSRLGSEIFR